MLWLDCPIKDNDAIVNGQSNCFMNFVKKSSVSSEAETDIPNEGVEDEEKVNATSDGVTEVGEEEEEGEEDGGSDDNDDDDSDDKDEELEKIREKSKENKKKKERESVVMENSGVEPAQKKRKVDDSKKGISTVEEDKKMVQVSCYNVKISLC